METENSRGFVFLAMITAASELLELSPRRILQAEMKVGIYTVVVIIFLFGRLDCLN